MIKKFIFCSHFLVQRPLCILSGNILRFLLPFKAPMHKHVVIFGIHRKKGHKTFCFGNGMASTAPSIQNYCSILTSALFQLLFWPLHLGMSGTFCQELPRAGHVQNSLAWIRLMSGCVVWGSVPWALRGLGWPQSLGESSTRIMESQELLQFGGGLPAAASLTRVGAKVGKNNSHSHS